MEEKIKGCNECPYHEQMMLNAGMDKLIWCPYIDKVYKNKIPRKCPYKILKEHDKKLVSEVCDKIEEHISDNIEIESFTQEIELMEFFIEIQKEYNK